jgi:hypothetical protein
MGLSINPSSIFKIITDTRYAKIDKLAEYLDAVARDAFALAKVWEETANALIAQERFDVQSKFPRIRALVGTPPNLPWRSRLDSFYHRMSRTIGGQVSNYTLENIMGALGALLLQRDITVKAYEETIGAVQSTFLLDSTNKPEDFLDLKESIVALYREAAALDAVAKEYRLHGQ